MVQQTHKISRPLDVSVEKDKILVTSFSGDKYPVTLNRAREIQQELNNAINQVSDHGLTGPALFELVLEKACFYSAVRPAMITGKSRRREYVIVRQMLMAYLWNRRNYSLKTIGGFFGNRDHTTVIYARQTVGNLCDTNEDYKRSYEKLTDYLNDVVCRKVNQS